MRLVLSREWDVGDQIGEGGFGRVLTAQAMDGSQGSFVAKFVRKEPGAQRELLFVKLDNVRNVVPIVDSGETDDAWVLIMPRADNSLRQFMDEAGNLFDAASAVPILEDIAIALADMKGTVVHRDLKPENVLLLNGKWCLADFGISRYAEATTAPDTQKFALSAPYAAPERWRIERATAAVDIYALGVIGFELLSGVRPFVGPDFPSYRDQHLHKDAPPLSGVPSSLVSLIAECLYKAPGARPGPENLLARLKSVEQAPLSAGRARLRDANMQVVGHQSESARQASVMQSENERRHDLFRDAQASFKRISNELKAAISADAPAATVKIDRDGSWNAQMSQAQLGLNGPKALPESPWGGWEPPKFDVVAYASISVRIPRSRYDYEGRGHSLWFCDAREAGQYRWFEMAFMITPGIMRSSTVNPFGMDLGDGAAKALGSGIAEFQLAWPFTQLDTDNLTDFVYRWFGWFADAVQGRLQHPSTMPERETQGSWRR